MIVTQDALKKTFYVTITVTVFEEVELIVRRLLIGTQRLSRMDGFSQM